MDPAERTRTRTIEVQINDTLLLVPMELALKWIRAKRKNSNIASDVRQWVSNKLQEEQHR